MYVAFFVGYRKATRISSIKRYPIFLDYMRQGENVRDPLLLYTTVDGP
jgi:hypothetical protein